MLIALWAMKNNDFMQWNMKPESMKVLSLYIDLLAWEPTKKEIKLKNNNKKEDTLINFNKVIYSK